MSLNFDRKKRGLAAVLVVAVGALLFYSRMSDAANRDFLAARDLPRGALIFAQSRNLPELVRRWDESALKQKYLASENFSDLQSRHLGLKIAERYEDYSRALGFAPDWSTLADASNQTAAIAVYDLGKIDAVFVAPLSADKFAATMFAQNQANFEVVELDENTVYYRVEVEVDRQRQRQKIAFANSRERFVLATNEQLLLRTLANINRKIKNDCLADEPDFASLTENATVHDATIWVDQRKLNADWYFKHYWLMSRADKLKNIRAGLFDLTMQPDKWIERREFLLDAAENQPQISTTDADELRALILPDAAFYKLETANEDSANLIVKTVFTNAAPKTKEKRAARWQSSSYGYSDYSSDADFDQIISDEDDKFAANRPEQSVTDELRQILANAEPTATAIFVEPRVLPAPQFAEFERGGVFKLRAAAKFDRARFENALQTMARRRFALADGDANLQWQTQNARRELDLPMLGRQICYAFVGDNLIVTNNRAALTAIVGERKFEKSNRDKAAFTDLTVIRLDKRETAFDQVFNRLDRETDGDTDLSETFFSGNVGSLLNVAKDARQIEIKRDANGKRLREEVTLILQ